MREILFRGQTRRYGEKVRMNGEKVPSNWVYGGCLQGTGVFSIIYGGENENDPGENLEKRVVYTDTLGQFIPGLVDKNGKKVFENDIVVICYETDGEEFSETKRVHYNEKECCWYPMRWEECCDHCDYYTKIKSIEVIGNIHDNPELLEVAEDGK